MTFPIVPPPVAPNLGAGSARKASANTAAMATPRKVAAASTTTTGSTAATRAAATAVGGPASRLPVLSSARGPLSVRSSLEHSSVAVIDGRNKQSNGSSSNRNSGSTKNSLSQTAPACLTARPSGRQAVGGSPPSLPSQVGPPSGPPKLGRRRTLELHEPTVCLNWSLSARETTPNSQYDPLQSAATRGDDPAPEFDSVCWLQTMRTALDAAHARLPRLKEPEGTLPAAACSTKAQWKQRITALAMVSADPASRCSCLDGHWLSEDDNQYLGCALKGYFYFKDGSQTKLSVHGDRADMVRLRLEGVYHYGMLSEDGRRLRWSDGDAWLRLCPQSSTDEAARLAADWSFDMEESLRWQNWSAQTRFLQSSHTAKSLAAAAHVSRSMMSREALADNLSDYFAVS